MLKQIETYRKIGLSVSFFSFYISLIATTLITAIIYIFTKNNLFFFLGVIVILLDSYLFPALIGKIEALNVQKKYGLPAKKHLLEQFSIVEYGGQPQINLEQFIENK